MRSCLAGKDLTVCWKTTVIAICCVTGCSFPCLIDMSRQLRNLRRAHGCHRYVFQQTAGAVERSQAKHPFSTFYYFLYRAGNYPPNGRFLAITDFYRDIRELRYEKRVVQAYLGVQRRVFIQDFQVSNKSGDRAAITDRVHKSSAQKSSAWRVQTCPPASSKIKIPAA
jgi:hypothetical protein